MKLNIIFLPGLNDQHPVQRKLVSLFPLLWEELHIKLHVIPMYWEKREPYHKKQKRILTVVDSLLTTHRQVAIMGQSAGGSAAGNIFAARKNKLACFINITGRLKEGFSVYPSLKHAARNSRSFAESVKLFETKNEPKLSMEDRKRILTIRPFIDEVVPADCVPVYGATNLVAPFPEHAIGGILIDIFYREKIRSFIRLSLSLLNC